MFFIMLGQRVLTGKDRTCYVLVIYMKSFNDLEFDVR
jgi:hypothetical protein